MKKTLLILLFSVPVFVSAQPVVDWVNVYGQPYDKDIPVNVGTDGEGNVYVGANMGGFNPVPKVRLAKYSAAGTLL